MPGTDPLHERGGGDHVQPYTFGHPPTWTSPTPFTPGQMSWLIFHRGDLAIVIGLAMVINNLIAGLSGVLIPVTLDRFRIDPAVSSAVFVTMMTDCMGFFSFLGLALLWGLSG